MAFTYVLGNVKSEALHWIRSKIGDTIEDRHQLEDEEISAALNDHGLTDTAAPADNRSNAYKAAADCARLIAARFGKDSEIAITEVGQVKSDAAGFYLRLAKQFEAEASPVQPEDLAPAEEMDSLDYSIDRLGRQRGEFVGDTIV